jgi:ribosomal protein S19E (S16A)
MLALLQYRRKTRSELLDEYEAAYGQAHRLEELLRAGLVVRGPQGIEVTPKGRLIVRAAGWLQ